jgi:hypothetical protein
MNHLGGVRRHCWLSRNTAEIQLTPQTLFRCAGPGFRCAERYVFVAGGLSGGRVKGVGAFPGQMMASGLSDLHLSSDSASTDRCSPAIIGSQTSSSSPMSDVSDSSICSLHIHPSTRR